MSKLQKTGEVKPKGDLARKNLFVVDRGEEIFTQPYRTCTYEITPVEGTYLMVADFINKRDKVLKASSENGKLSSSEIDELESDGLSLGGLYMGKTTVTMRKRFCKEQSPMRPALNGDLLDCFLPRDGIKCLDDAIGFMESTITHSIPYNGANRDKDLTVGQFVREGGTCAHFAQFLSKALDKEGVKNTTVRGLAVNTVDDGVKRYSSMAEAGIGYHAFVEARFGGYYWIDPTTWTGMSRENGWWRYFDNSSRRFAAGVRDSAKGNVTSPNLFEWWLGPRKSIDDDTNLYYAESIEILP